MLGPIIGITVLNILIYLEDIIYYIISARGRIMYYFRLTNAYLPNRQQQLLHSK